MNLSIILDALKIVPAVVAQAPAFTQLIAAAADLLDDEDDTKTAKEALADLQLDNDEGFARLDAKQAAAARR